MKVLFTATQDSPSFEVRGRQIAATRKGWHAQLGIENHHKYDVVVAVKRFDPAWRYEIHQPMVLDVLDFWKQPQDDVFVDDFDTARNRLIAHVETLSPHACIAATRTMAADLSAWRSPTRVKAIPHHYRPGMGLNPIREQVKHIGYEGTVSYLGEWHDVLVDDARALGARFIINPPDYLDIDIAVSVRGKLTRSVFTKRWKSGVKAANMVGSGTPGVCLWEHGAAEVTGATEFQDGTGALTLVRTLPEMREELQRLMDPAARREMRAKQDEMRPRFSVEAIAAEYETFLTGLVEERLAA